MRSMNRGLTPRGLAVCRIAACGGVCGAVITLAGVLCLAFVLMAGESMGYLTPLVDVAIAASGVAIMWLADRFGARSDVAAPPFASVKLRLVSEDPSRRSAA